MFIDTIAPPRSWRAIEARTRAMGFDMPSDPAVGAALRSLAAAKPGGRLLELGTGTGLATAYLLAGMDNAARLVSVDTDPVVQDVARQAFADDRRVNFVTADGLAFIQGERAGSYDLIFADAWPGKYEGLDAALALLAPGGLYVIDDMLPQPNWPEGHQANVDALIGDLTSRRGLAVSLMPFGSGMVVATRQASRWTPA